MKKTNSLSLVNWTPKREQGLVLWLAADKGVILGNASGSNSTVLRWEDQSGRGNHVSQTNIANQPLYKSRTSSSLGGLYDRPTLSFTNDHSSYLQSEATYQDLAPTAISFFAVARALGPLQSVEFIGGRGDTGSNGYWWGLSTNMRFFVGNGATQNQLGTQALTATEWCIWAGTYDKTIQQAWKNGVITNTGTTVTGDISYSGVPTFYVGNTTGLTANRYWNGEIAEILIYNRALEKSKIQRINNYLSNKYGIKLYG